MNLFPFILFVTCFSFFGGMQEDKVVHTIKVNGNWGCQSPTFSPVSPFVFHSGKALCILSGKTVINLPKQSLGQYTLYKNPTM